MYSDPAIDSRPALLITVHIALLGPQWYITCVSLRSGRISCFLHVKRWITDPEVDSRPSGHVFRFLVPDSHLWIFWEMTSGIISVFSTLWFDSTCRRQSMRLLEEFHTFWNLVFQRNACFDSGFLLMRQTTEALVWKWPFSPSTLAVACARPFVGSGTASRVVSDKDVDLPVVVLDRCPVSTCRKLRSSHLQFVDQVETSLFDNRDRYAHCAVVSCPEGLFLGPCTQVQERGGHVHRDMTRGIRCIRDDVSPETCH